MFGREHSDAFNNGSDDLVEPSIFVPLPEAARLLGDVTVREVYFRIEAGDLLSVKQGRRRMVVRASLDQYAARLIREEQERVKAAQIKAAA